MSQVLSQVIPNANAHSICRNKARRSTTGEEYDATEAIEWGRKEGDGRALGGFESSETQRAIPMSNQSGKALHAKDTRESPSAYYTGQRIHRIQATN